MSMIDTDTTAPRTTPRRHHRSERPRLSDLPRDVRRQREAQIDLVRARNMMTAWHSEYERKLQAARELGLNPRY